MLQTMLLLLITLTLAFAKIMDYEVIQDAVETSQVEMRNEFKDSLDDSLISIRADLKLLRADNVLLHKELSKARSIIRTFDATTNLNNCVDKDEVTRMVSRLLDSHTSKQTLLSSRLEVLEQREKNGKALASPSAKRRQSRRLVDASVLEDAALWMQANRAKILFGPEADANLYRSGTSELTTDSNVNIKKNLKVLGENWNLATLMEAKENIAVGDVISMCQGKACVGYGLQHTGYKQTSDDVNNVRLLFLGGTNSLTVMWYLRASPIAHRLPVMRMIKTEDTNGDIGGDPVVGPETYITGTDDSDKVFEPNMIKLDTDKFLIVYRKSTSPSNTDLSTATDVQGAIKLGEINSVSDSTFKASDEVVIPNVGGYGIKRAMPVALGTTKFAVVLERSDLDTSGAWLGSVAIAIGNIALTSGGDRGITISAAVTISTYSSEIHAVSFNDFKHVAIAYRERNALKTQDQGVIVIMATSTSIPSVVTRFTFSDKQVRFLDLTVIATKSMVLLYRLPKTQYVGKGVILTLTTSDTTIESTMPVAIAPPSAHNDGYVLRTALINPGQIVLAYRNEYGKTRIVDIDIVGTTLVVGTSRKFHTADPACFSYDIVGLTSGPHFLLVYQDNRANIPDVGTLVVGSTHGGALRVGVATTAGSIGDNVQVAMEGAVKIPTGTVRLGLNGIALTPGARYYAKYDGGISSSPEDGVLLGRALRDSLLLLERDFAGGFELDINSQGMSIYTGEIRALAGAVVPSGWLVCDGRSVDRLVYASLFSAIGTKWGAGDGSVTFNIPDLRGRGMIGTDIDGSGTYAGAIKSRDIGDKGGKILTCDRTTSPGTNYGSIYGECHAENSNDINSHEAETLPPFGVVNFMIKI